MASSINASTSAGLVTSADTSGDLNIQSGGSTKIAVTSAGVAVTGLSKASLPTGSVLQVVQGVTTTSVSSSSTTYADTGLTATITPTSATSKILVLITHPTNYKTNGNSLNGFGFRVLKNGSSDYVFGNSVGYTAASSILYMSIAFNYLDSPATTSALTYKTQFNNYNVSAASVTVCSDSTPSTIILMEIAA